MLSRKWQTRSGKSNRAHYLSTNCTRFFDYILLQNVYHSRADFLNLKREDGVTAAEVWKRILEVVKNCKFESLTAAESLASKFQYFIGKSTVDDGDDDLKIKIRNIDMSVEAITDALHEYMYEKVIDKSEAQEEKKIRYPNNRKIRRTKEQPDKPPNFKKFNCNCCGAPNWSRPARGKKCATCGKIGHFAKGCRANRKVNHLMEGETSSAGKDDWTPNTIH